MQYAVPQFTDVEDKLIGPLTLKQFLVFLAFGGLDLLFWSIFKLSILFFLLALPITLVGLFFTFGSFNGRPVMNYLGAFIAYTGRPQVRVFKREEPNIVTKIEKKQAVKVETNKVNEESAESRLKKLAYLLDQKVQEEQELIDKPKNG